jgi:hypothetical protein
MSVRAGTCLTEAAVHGFHHQLQLHQQRTIVQSPRVVKAFEVSVAR